MVAEEAEDPLPPRGSNDGGMVVVVGVELIYHYTCGGGRGCSGVGGGGGGGCRGGSGDGSSCRRGTGEGIGCLITGV